MASRDVDELARQLRAAARAADKLAEHLADLHDLAYSRHIGDTVKVSGGEGDEDGGRGDRPGLESVGDPRARSLWHRLNDAAKHLEVIVAVEWATMNLLSAGPRPDATRGSYISPGEFGRAQRNQRDRQAAGEHVPTLIAEQPPYPGAGR